MVVWVAARQPRSEGQAAATLRMALRPEETIRHYLDEHEGRVDAHIRHLLDSFGFAEAGDDALEAIEGALTEVGVRSEPALQEVPETGWLTLFVVEDEPELVSMSQPPEVASDGSTAPSEHPEAAEEELEPQRRRGRFRRPEPGQEGSEPRPRRGRRRFRKAEAVEAEPAAPIAQEEAIDEAVGDEELDSRTRLDSTLEAVGRDLALAYEGAAATTEALEALREVAERQVEELDAALSAAREGGPGASELEQHIGTLIEAEQGARAQVEAERGEVAGLSEQTMEAERHIATARDELMEALRLPEQQAEIERRLQTLGEAEQRTYELRETHAAEIEALAAATREAEQKVIRMRASVNEAASQPELRGELDQR